MLSASLETSPSTGTDRLALHRTLCALRLEQVCLETRLALLLAHFERERGFEALGCSSIREYAELHLQLSARQTMDFVRLGRRLPGLPVVEAALESGELGMSKARELLRVITPETEDAWVQYATEVSCHELEHAVAASVPGDLPPEDEAPVAPARVRLTFEVAATDAEVIRTAIAELRAEDPDADAGALLAQLVRRARLPAVAPSDETPIPEARYRVVVEHCPSCQKLTHVGHSGRRDVGPAVAAEIACDHEQVDLTHAVTPGRLTRDPTETVRRRVYHRDGYRCVVPGCCNTTWLDVHHLVRHADGGDRTEYNLITICGTHHRALHEGRLTIARAPDGTLTCQRRVLGPQSP